MIIILFFAAHWYLSLFIQTFFHHRYAAHRMFTMSPLWEKTFFVLSFIFQGSSYLSPYAYGILHRLHHAYADTEKDPHSPKYDKNLFHMMWKTRSIYLDILADSADVEEKYKKDLPKWTALDMLASNWYIRSGCGVLYILFYVWAISIAQFPGTHWAMYALLPMHFFMGPLHGAIINWFAHKVGYTNFELKDTSKNLFPVDFLMLGEGFHNNHHKYGSRPDFGYKWYEIDPIYPFIKLFDAVGVIRLRKPEPVKMP